MTLPYHGQEFFLLCSSSLIFRARSYLVKRKVEEEGKYNNLKIFSNPWEFRQAADRFECTTHIGTCITKE